MLVNLKLRPQNPATPQADLDAVHIYYVKENKPDEKSR